MIAGRVVPGGEAVVSLRVSGQSGQVANVQTVVDTGFNEYITLPPWVIERLDLSPRENDIYLLADGTTRDVRKFVAEVEWLGIWRRVLVVEIDGNPLLGMTLMQGHHLAVDVIAGGRVEIRPLAS